MALRFLKLAAGFGLAVSFGGCGGVASDEGAPRFGAGASDAVGSAAGEGGFVDIGTGGSGLVQAGKAGAAGAAGAPQGGATNDRCLARRDEPPGTPVYDLSTIGEGQCAEANLAGVIDRIRELRPDLADVTTLHGAELEGDGNRIYAFQHTDGGFALVFVRGSGDCPSGCTSHDYWYFETGLSCAPTEIGEAHRDGEHCMQPDQLPRWGIPVAALPREICGADLSPQDLTGVYSLPTCGQSLACTGAGKTPGRSSALPASLELTIQQLTDDPSRGSVTLRGTGEPLLDGVKLDATFERRKLKVSAQYSNLPSLCLEEWSFTFEYDFEGFEARQLSLDFVHTPECAISPDDYCKGQVTADFGQGFRIGEACELSDCEGLDEVACTARVASKSAGGCLPRWGRPQGAAPDGAPLYAGCAPTCCTSDEECPGNVDAEVCAADPEGTCWMLSSPPVPVGWKLLSEVDGCESLPECSEK